MTLLTLLGAVERALSVPAKGRERAQKEPCEVYKAAIRLLLIRLMGSSLCQVGLKFQVQQGQRVLGGGMKLIWAFSFRPARDITLGSPPPTCLLLALFQKKYKTENHSSRLKNALAVLSSLTTVLSMKCDDANCKRSFIHFCPNDKGLLRNAALIPTPTCRLSSSVPCAALMLQLVKNFGLLYRFILNLFSDYIL